MFILITNVTVNVPLIPPGFYNKTFLSLELLGNLAQNFKCLISHQKRTCTMVPIGAHILASQKAKLYVLWNYSTSYTS